MNQPTDEIIGQIEGSTTPFGFKIKLNKSIPRKSFIAVKHGPETFVLSIIHLWNNDKGYFGECKIIGNPPLTPFPIDSKIRLATLDEIQKAIGLETSEEKGANLGDVFGITGLRALINVEKLGRVFITGKSGSGKSYTAGVLLEELLKKGISLILIDRHGEYSTLKLLDRDNIPDSETFFDKNDPEYSFRKHIIEFAETKYNPQADLPLKYLPVIQMKELILPGQCVSINLKGVDIPIQNNLIDQFLARLYKASTMREIPPVFVFLDEAHLFAGKKSSKTLETVKLIAQEGRKFGCNLVVITQKPQALDTTVRAQAGTWFIHKLTDVNDIRITTTSAEGLDSHDEDEIQNLMPGEAIITGDITPFCPIQIKIRKRYTIHGGAGINVLQELGEESKITRSDLIAKIRDKYTEESLEQSTTDIFQKVQLSTTELYNRIDDLRQENYELKQKIQNLQNLQTQLTQKSGTSGSASNPVNNELPETIKIASEIDQVLNEIEKDVVTSGSADIPKPEQMYDKKMTELMAERDDLKSEIVEKTKILDKLKPKLDKMMEQIQTFELEISGLKVENQDLKDKLKTEQKRADDAVKLAERAVQTMKKKGKYR